MPLFKPSFPFKFPRVRSVILAALFCGTLSSVVFAAEGIEPRNAEEAQRQNKYAEKIREDIYSQWVDYVKASEPEKQVWLHTLEDNLGGYYFPVLLTQTLFGPRPYYEPADP